jgi:hypothetical protein
MPFFPSIGVVAPRGGFRWPRPPHFASGRASTRLFLLFALETSRRRYCLSTEDLSGKTSLQRAEDLSTESRGSLYRRQRTSLQKAEDLSTEDRGSLYRRPLFYESNRRDVFASFHTICMASSLIAIICASLQWITRSHKRLNIDDCNARWC